MAGQTSRVGFTTYQDGEDWDYNPDFEALDAVVPTGLADSGTLTLSGGSSPAANETITGVSDAQAVALRAVVGVDADPSFDADYAFNYDVSRAWDDSNSQWNVTITVNWDTDPGAGNDVTASYRIYEE